MFTEHLLQALCRQFIHASSHLILTIIPGGRYCDCSLSTDTWTEAQNRARPLPKSHCTWGKPDLNPVSWTPRTMLLFLHGATSQVKWGSITSIPIPPRGWGGVSLGARPVHDGDWTPVCLCPSQEVLSFPIRAVSTTHVLLLWLSKPRREMRYLSSRAERDEISIRQG